jgi:hypothetical protein
MLNLLTRGGQIRGEIRPGFAKGPSDQPGDHGAGFVILMES